MPPPKLRTGPCAAGVVILALNSLLSYSLRSAAAETASSFGCI